MSSKALAILSIFTFFFSITTSENNNVACDLKEGKFQMYFDLDITYYKCDLYTKHFDDENPQKIIGDHTRGKKDSDVKCITKYINHLLKKFSSIYCEKFRNIEAIEISNAEMKVVNEDSLQKCENLIYLRLDTNQISELSENLLINNKKLKILWLQHNKLKTLPEYFLSNQIELEHLILNGNQIGSLPSKIFNSLVKLKFLLIHGNKVKTLDPSWFANLKNLEYLDLKENHLSVLHADAFDTLESLKVIDLSDNFISEIPHGTFVQLRNLTRFHMSNNNLSNIHTNSFSFHYNLTLINLQDNKIILFDEMLINKTAVNMLNMTNNICSSFYAKKRDVILKKLRTCFADYDQSIYIEHETSTSAVNGKSRKVFHSDNNSGSCGRPTVAVGNIIGGSFITRGSFPW